MLLCCSRNSLQIQFSSFSSLLLFGKREEGVIEFFQDFTFSENLCHLQTFFQRIFQCTFEGPNQASIHDFFEFQVRQDLKFLTKEVQCTRPLVAILDNFQNAVAFRFLCFACHLVVLHGKFESAMDPKWHTPNLPCKRIVYAMPLCGLCVQKVYFDFMHNSNQF